MDKTIYHIERAQQLYELKRYESCFTEARESLQYDSKNPFARHLMMLSLIHLERFEEAEEFGEKSLGLNPDSELVLYSMGILFLQQDEYVEAKSYFEAALKMNPLNESCYFQLAKCYLGFGQLEHADALLKRCLNLDPNNEYALNLKSQIELHLNEYSEKEAYRTLGKAMSAAPESAHNHFVKANFHWKNKETDKAEFHYQQALQIDPMHEEARALWMEMRSRSVPFWDSVLQLYPGGTKSVLFAFLLLGVFTFPPNLYFLTNIGLENIPMLGYVICFLTLIPSVIFWMIRPFFKHQLLNKKWGKMSLEISNPSLPIEVLATVAIFSSLLLWIFQKELFFGSWFVSMLLGFILVQEKNNHSFYPIFKNPIRTSLISIFIVLTLVTIGKVFEEPSKDKNAMSSNIKEEAYEEIELNNSEKVRFLKPIKIVDLSSKELSGLSAEMEVLKEASILKLDDNEFEEIPEVVSVFENLYFLSLKNNKIQSVPRFLFEMKNLKFIDLDGNPISGEELEKIKTEMPGIILGPMEYESFEY